MNDIPYINIDDKINATLLDNNYPALILEGNSDFDIFLKLLDNSKLDWANIDIVIGESKSQILELHKNGLPFGYIAVIDADYDRYNNCIIHDWNLIYTHFYSIENYLTRPEVISAAINDFKVLHDPKITASAIIQEAIELLHPFISAQLEKMHYRWIFPLEKHRIERWWDSKKSCMDCDALFDHITKNLRVCDLPYTKEQWIQCLASSREKIKELIASDRIDMLVCGKIKLDAVYYCFVKYFRRTMRNRHKMAFSVDLCKHILQSKEARDILDKIDDKLSKLIA